MVCAIHAFRGFAALPHVGIAIRDIEVRDDEGCQPVIVCHAIEGLQQPVCHTQRLHVPGQRMRSAMCAAGLKSRLGQALPLIEQRKRWRCCECGHGWS